MPGMSVKTILIDAFDAHRFVARNPRGDRITVEAHTTAPGPDAPPSIGLGPMETLLAALGTCSAVDVQEIMRKRRTPLTRYRLELVGERADTVPARYTRITIRHVGGGDGVTQDAFEKAARLSTEKYCSVAASLDPSIEITVEARLDTPQPETAGA